MNFLRKAIPRPKISLDFVLPDQLEATEPPEARGLVRDGVRLLVSEVSQDRLTHAHFHDLGRFLTPGDLLVINTSGTRPAALPAIREDGTRLTLHLSTNPGGNRWVVELRQPAGPDRSIGGSEQFRTGVIGETLSLPEGGEVKLIAPYSPRTAEGVRLWDARLHLPLPVDDYLTRYGQPIRYNYVPQFWPIEYYQTVFATEMGSAEMPSAGRAFTPELVTWFVSQGIQFAPLVLHTGVASLEDHEPPYAEFYSVPPETARLINRAKEDGRRVIAVGTTVVRALETVTDETGKVRPGTGWTEVIITPERGIRAANGLLTGLHEPHASHLAMLEAFASRAHLANAYEAALSHGYLWHEFGDLHLLLP